MKGICQCQNCGGVGFLVLAFGGHLYLNSLQTTLEAKCSKTQKILNLVPTILLLYHFFKLFVNFPTF